MSQFEELKTILEWSEQHFLFVPIFIQPQDVLVLKNELNIEATQVLDLNHDKENDLARLLTKLQEPDKRPLLVNVPASAHTEIDRNFIYARLNERRHLLEQSCRPVLLSMPPEDVVNHQFSYMAPDLWHVRAMSLNLTHPDNRISHGTSASPGL